MDRAFSEMAYPTRIVLGAGAIERVGGWCRRLEMKKPLVVTDLGIVRAGLLDRLGAELRRDGVSFAIFDGVEQNFSDRDVEAGVDAYLAHGSDGLIGLGGGSSLDTAKLVRLLSTHERPLSRYAVTEREETNVVHELPPMIAVPTTAGTGSEVSPRAVAVLAETGRKALFSAPPLIPDVAICDPQLTCTLGPGPTAWTGIDALVQCVESWCATGFHPLADALAIDGAARCARALVRAVQEPQDLAARTELMIAAIEGAAAAQKGLGACDAVANAAAAVVGLRHGMAAGICLPEVLDFNRPAVGRRLAKLAVALGEDPTMRDDLLANAGVERVARLIREVNLPSGFKEAGVTEAQLSVIVAQAAQDASVRTNPRKLGRGDLEGILRAAF